jgi:hypothetical protein
MRAPHPKEYLTRLERGQLREAFGIVPEMLIQIVGDNRKLLILTVSIPHAAVRLPTQAE